MQIISDIAELRRQIKAYKMEGKKVSVVPTMGNLHEGHLSLAKKARSLSDVVVVTCFVNPMQFNQATDFANYPKTIEEDCAKLIEQGNTDIFFAPSSDAIYPNGLERQTFVEVPTLSHMLEGASRPGHYRGVATIVTKLFNMVQPDIAFFGEKDFQQLAVIRQMTTDLNLDIEIVGLPTVREHDGLAMSSRNNLLTIDERQRAPVIYKTMRWISSAIRGGRTDHADIILDAKDQLRAADFQPDEIFIKDAKTLKDIDEKSTQIVILMAAFLGSVRLIDNLVIELYPESRETAAASTVH